MADNQNQGEAGDIDDENNLAFLPADHPLYERLQQKLQAQLTQEHQRVDLELIEVEASLKKMERVKEDVGVRLYAVQQQLAENQINFEQAHENYNLVQKLRIEAEQKQKQENETYQAKKKEVDDLQKKYFKSQDELSKLTRTLIQIQNYNDQIKAQLEITKRTTYRAEENVVLQELEKKKQDNIIDSMNEEIKRLTEQKTIIIAQLMSQKEETEQAKSILKEAHLEMQKIVASKKNLLERWQKSLMTMQRMDTALQAIKEALNQQKELNIQIGSELNGVSAEIHKEALISEELQAKNHKLKMEKKNLEGERERLIEDMKKLEAQIELLNKSLKITEDQANKAEEEKKKIDIEMTEIEKNIMKLHQETKDLFKKLIDTKGKHTTIEKTAAKLNKQANEVQYNIEEKNVELENILNEIVRIKIDQLNTQSQIELLETKKIEVNKEKEQKKLTIKIYQDHIRTGLDLNKKKQQEVGKLNNLFDELSKNQNESSSGPLEAEKNKWKRLTEELKAQCEVMHRDWIKNQSKLVLLNNQFEQKSELVSNMKTKEMILEQKKLRLNQTYRNHEKDIRDIQNSLKNLQNEMNKLNDSLYINREQDRKLENEYFNISSEFTEKLKELEKESVRLEIEIDSLKEQKAELLTEIVECERQILLWERKIQLEKEMQETLDPTVGQSEIKELQKEIHLMELRHEELRKSQEAIISKMEKAFDKRDTIQLKYQKKSSVSSGQPSVKSNPPADTTAAIHKQIQSLKQTLNQTTQNSKQLDNAIRERISELEILNQQIEDAGGKFEMMEQEITGKNVDLTNLKIMRQINIYRIAALQGQAKKYEEIMQGKAKLSYPIAQLNTKFEEQKFKNEQIKNNLEQLLKEGADERLRDLLIPVFDMIREM